MATKPDSQTARRVRKKDPSAGCTLPEGLVFSIPAARRQNLLGKRIRAIRENRGMTLRDVSDGLAFYGLPAGPSSIAKWESGLAVPRGKVLLALYAVFDLPGDSDFLFSPLPGPFSPREALAFQFSQRLERCLMSTRAFEPVRERVAEAELPLLRSPGEKVGSRFPALDDYTPVRLPETDIPYGTDFLYPWPEGLSLRFPTRYACVSRCTKLITGDVGLVICQGRVLMRLYYEYLGPDPSGYVSPVPIVLHALSGSEDPIFLASPGDFRVLGRVLV